VNLVSCSALESIDMNDAAALERACMSIVQFFMLLLKVRTPRCINGKETPHIVTDNWLCSLVRLLHSGAHALLARAPKH
jgi:hypothetical protein